MKIYMEIIDCRMKYFTLEIILTLLYFRNLLSDVASWFRHLPFKIRMYFYFVYQEMQTEKGGVGGKASTKKRKTVNTTDLH